MSYNEYNDLLLKCQKTGKYRVFTIDLMNSSSMNSELRFESQYSLITLIERIYQDILMLEKELNKRILIKDEGFDTFLDKQELKNEGQMPYDWFLYGDAVGLTIHNNSIPREVIYKIISLNIKELNLENMFHIYDLVYETNDYKEGPDKYFRGYAIQASTTIHKKATLKKQIDNLKQETKENIDNYIRLIIKNHPEALRIAEERLTNLIIIAQKNHINLLNKR